MIKQPIVFSTTHGLLSLCDLPLQVFPSPILHRVVRERLFRPGAGLFGTTAQKEIRLLFFSDYRQLDLNALGDVGVFATDHDRQV